VAASAFSQPVLESGELLIRDQQAFPIRRIHGSPEGLEDVVEDPCLGGLGILLRQTSDVGHVLQIVAADRRAQLHVDGWKLPQPLQGL